MTVRFTEKYGPVEGVYLESPPGRGPENRPACPTYIIGQVHLYKLPAPAMNDQERLDKEAMYVSPGRQRDTERRSVQSVGFVISLTNTGRDAPSVVDLIVVLPSPVPDLLRAGPVGRRLAHTPRPAHPTGLATLANEGC